MDSSLLLPLLLLLLLPLLLLLLPLLLLPPCCFLLCLQLSFACCLLFTPGPVGYCADAFNVFDGVVVLVSVVEVALDLAAVGGGVNIGALRTLRLARAFKLARSFGGLRAMINTMRNSVTQA